MQYNKSQFMSFSEVNEAMGRVKNSMIEEQARKREEMEAMPHRLDDALDRIDELRDELEQSNTTISELRHNLKEANSLKSKVKDYIVGGLVGAVIGLILSALFL